jgi:type I restriction enzyme, R subunit
VRSKTKFWQMIGRGTRLRPDLFGPGQDKEFFYVFDYCQNLEFFHENPPVSDGAVGESLGVLLFKTRLQLIVALDAPEQTQGDGLEGGTSGLTHQQLRAETAELLRTQVAAMNLNNFVVRPQRRLVEHYATEEAWTKLGPEQVGELAEHVASLPTELPAEDEEASRAHRTHRDAARLRRRGSNVLDLQPRYGGYWDACK